MAQLKLNSAVQIGIDQFVSSLVPYVNYRRFVLARGIDVWAFITAGISRSIYLPGKNSSVKLALNKYPNARFNPVFLAIQIRFCFVNEPNGVKTVLKSVRFSVTLRQLCRPQIYISKLTICGCIRCKNKFLKRV